MRSPCERLWYFRHLVRHVRRRGKMCKEQREIVSKRKEKTRVGEEKWKGRARNKGGGRRKNIMNYLNFAKYKTNNIKKILYVYIEILNSIKVGH